MNCVQDETKCVNTQADAQPQPVVPYLSITNQTYVCFMWKQQIFKIQINNNLKETW
jgi:hypothetical protein